MFRASGILQTHRCTARTLRGHTQSPAAVRLHTPHRASETAQHGHDVLRQGMQRAGSETNLHTLRERKQQPVGCSHTQCSEHIGRSASENQAYTQPLAARMRCFLRGYLGRTQSCKQVQQQQHGEVDVHAGLGGQPGTPACQQRQQRAVTQSPHQRMCLGSRVQAVSRVLLHTF